MSELSRNEAAPCRGARDRFIDCGLLPGEITVLMDHHLALAAELRARGAAVAAEKLAERVGELQLRLALGATWAGTVWSTAR